MGMPAKKTDNRITLDVIRQGVGPFIYNNPSVIDSRQTTDPKTVIEFVIAFYTEQESRKSKKGSQWKKGAWHQRDRVKAIAQAMVRLYYGDLVEIGCYKGDTTYHLATAALASPYSRVFAVDPWEPGTQNCTGSEYAQFQKTLRLGGQRSRVVVLRTRSDDPIVRVALETPLAFAFVDGLHTYEAATNDIEIVSHARVIAVDDIAWSEGVRRAYTEAIEKYGYIGVWDEITREGYLITPDA